MNYTEFLESKTHLGGNFGFEPLFMPDAAFDFQQSLIEWICLKGRGALYADCGLGKSLMQLAWAENVVRHTNKPVIVLTPNAVASQTVREGEKFGIECARSTDGKPARNITVTNYEKLHLFNPNDFIGCVCDESSILKNFAGATRSAVNQFMRKMKYRKLASATAAPNDFIELGTSSEALGHLGHMDMLSRFFRHVDATMSSRGHDGFRYKHKEKIDAMKTGGSLWRFKPHAEQQFWRWVCSWARAIRKPSDLGFDDHRFTLPKLTEVEHVVSLDKPVGDFLFPMIAIGLKEQREERKGSVEERCAKVAELVSHNEPALVWCHLNPEGDLLEKLIPGSVQVSGSDSDDAKEEKFMQFVDGRSRVLITKPKIGALGLNLQHCNHMTFFPSHSFEQYYQGVRRCWRFGQTREVRVDIVTTEGEAAVLKNLQRKQVQADKMFSNLVSEMNQALAIEKATELVNPEEIPSWLVNAN